MKHEEWVSRNINPQPGHVTFPNVDPKGLHVIGTCGECEYWGDLDMAWDKDGTAYRVCENKNIGIFSPMQRCGNEFSKNFGCIHFEAKGER